jgi:hypothetical protein
VEFNAEDTTTTKGCLPLSGGGDGAVAAADRDNNNNNNKSLRTGQ